MAQNEQIIGQTRKWITDVVIGCNFCPFAAREMNRNSIRYIVETGETAEQVLQTFLDECQHLDDNPATETTLIILTMALQDFGSYLDMLTVAEQALIDQDYEGTYQLASFHPDYRFEGAPVDDAANYTNRSPYPMLHLLREESIEKALEYYEGDAEDIPGRNVKFAREKGLTYMKMLRDSCL